MPLIYVSSPYQDLVEHRTAVFEAVRRLEHEPLGMESYSSEETRPIEKCLADVRRCRAYVGLVAWRYGSTPPGQAKSFTHLEYEEAGKHGIPRFVFLASESWPAAQRDRSVSRVTGFRQALREAHVLREFSNLDQLKYEVVAALRSLGVSQAIPPLLPFQCDRDDQYEDLSAGLHPSPPRPPLLEEGVPLVCFAHGGERQALGKFVQCVREQASAILSTPEQQAIAWRELPWPCEPSTASFVPSFLRRLGKALDSPAARTAQQVAGRIAQYTAPLIVHSRVYTDEWSPESHAMLAAACNQWLTLPVAAARWSPVLFLTLEYRDEANRLRRYFVDKRNRAVRRALLQTIEHIAPRGRLILLRELDDVKRHHVEEWSEREAVLTLIHGDDLTSPIAELFGSTLAMPMRPLAGALLTLLRASVSASH